MIAVCAAALSFGAVAATFITAEVYIKIPGAQAVHCPTAKVTLLGNGIVKVETPWGVIYTTHLANVVIVERRQGVEK